MKEESVKIPAVLIESRSRTEKKFAALLAGLEKSGAPEIVASHATCVYATGSLGRGEMSERSDLDIFILRNGSSPAPLNNLDEIRLKARLVEVAREQHYPDFSGDGKYVKAHDVNNDLVGKLGTSEDDYANVFTARMLLILESRYILGPEAYKEAIKAVVAVYWRDYAQNSRNFLPVFLMNDILRFWKTLCLNYEERTGSEKDTKAGKRRLQNYKLKHSRLLTCYSAIIFMQAVANRDNGTVSPEVVMQMISESPTKRLEFVADQLPLAREAVQKILDNYARFLVVCDAEKDELEEKFARSDFKRERFAEARQFGDDVFALLHLLGEGTPLLRYLVV